MPHSPIMAEHGISMSLSHTSDDSSSDQLTPAATHGGGSGVGSRRLPPSSSSGGHHPYQPLALPPPQKKPRGRPPGSKNKPKPPVVITQDSDQALKPVVIEVAAGADVVDAVVSFARRRHVSISVLSGSGTIANVTLRHPYSHAPALTLHGPFTMLSFTGSYVTGPFTAPPSSSSAPPRPPLAASSSSSANPTHPTCSSFAVSFSGSQGQIFGGVVAGNLVAASAVVVVASVFKKPEFHRVGFNGSGEGGGGGRDGGGGGDDDDDDDGDHHHNPSAGGGDHQGGDNTLSGFNVATAPSTMNCHPGDVNVMQWGHTLSSSRTANY